MVFATEARIILLGDVTDRAMSGSISGTNPGAVDRVDGERSVKLTHIKSDSSSII